jgi:hypothetical protein
MGNGEERSKSKNPTKSSRMLRAYTWVPYQKLHRVLGIGRLLCD